MSCLYHTLNNYHNDMGLKISTYNKLYDDILSNLYLTGVLTNNSTPKETLIDMSTTNNLLNKYDTIITPLQNDIKIIHTNFKFTIQQFIVNKNISDDNIKEFNRLDSDVTKYINDKLNHLSNLMEDIRSLLKPYNENKLNCILLRDGVEHEGLIYELMKKF